MRKMPKTYETLNLPPLTDEQLKRLKTVKGMKEEDIDTKDIPEWKFNDPHHYYAQSLRIKKDRICTTIDHDNIKWLKIDGKGYQTRLNAVIRWARMNGCPIEKFN